MDLARCLIDSNPAESFKARLSPTLVLKHE
jgi:hypothetical protein